MVPVAKDRFGLLYWKTIFIRIVIDPNVLVNIERVEYAIGYDEHATDG